MRSTTVTERKRRSPPFVTIVWCVVISACGSGGSGSTTPSGSSYDGQWSGTTSQGMSIAFAVSTEQRVTAITVGYSFNGCSGLQTFSNLNLDTAPKVTCIPGPCSPQVSSFRAFSYSAGSGDGPLTVVNGGFPSTNTAQGVVGFTNYPGCGTALGVGWTANRH
jgi:hypothetical protein